MITHMWPFNFRQWSSVLGIMLLGTMFSLSIAEEDDRVDQDPPVLVALVDASRSSSTYADRIHLLSDALLPWYGQRQLWSFDHRVRDRSTSGIAELEYTSIVSDYIQAFQALAAADRNPDLLLIIGNGFMDVVHGEMPEAYTQNLPPGSARDSINRAAYERFVEDYQAMLSDASLPLLILNPGQDEEGSLWSWLAGGRQGLSPIALEALSLRQIMQEISDHGFSLRGRLLGGAVVTITDTVTPLQIPEGSSQAEIIIHGMGNMSDYELGVSTLDGPLPTWDGMGDEPSGPYMRGLITRGVGRHILLGGVHDGLSLQVSLIGAQQEYEMAVRYHRHIHHSLALAPPPRTFELYTSDAVEIEHSWRRAIDGRALSPRLAESILGESQLQLSGEGPQPQLSADGTMLLLPDEAGASTLHLEIGERWQEMVDTEALHFTWQAAAPLILRGGWQQETIYDGAPAQLRFQREGGRRPLSDLAVELQGPASAEPSTLSVPLQRDPEQQQWTASVTFTDHQRGTWRIVSATPIQGDEESGQWHIAPEGADAIEVRRNWLPLLLAALAFLLLLLALLLWWLASRPRLRNEVLLSAGGQIRLADCPGPRARDTSCLFKDLDQAVVLRVNGKGHHIESIAEGCTVYVNARPVVPGAPVIPGNDIEVIHGQERRHGQFFTDPQGVTAWGPDQAQINPLRDLGEEYLVVDLSDTIQ